MNFIRHWVAIVSLLTLGQLTVLPTTLADTSPFRLVVTDMQGGMTDLLHVDGLQ